MKLSKTEKVVLAVFLVIVIIALGVILIILPEFNKIAPNNEALDTARTSRDAVYAALSRETTIDSEIEEAKKKADEFTEYFYDVMSSQDADILVRKFFNDNKLEILKTEIAPYTTKDLTLQYYVPTPVTFPISDEADIVNGEALTFDEDGNLIIQVPEGDTLATIKDNVQTVGVIDITVEFKGAKKNYLALLDYVKDLQQTTYIASADIPYTAESTSLVDEDGNEISISGTALGDNDEVKETVTVSFYCIKKLKNTVA